MNRRQRLAIALLAVGAWGAGGCTMPVAVWPEWPAGVDHTLCVERPGGGAADAGCVLLRIYRYNGAGLAEGDHNIRNLQVADAAFEYRRAVRVKRPDLWVRYRLVDVQPLPIGPDGTVVLPTVVKAGSLWVVSEEPTLRSGLHPRVHFAEVQALVPTCPPTARAEVTPHLWSLRAAAKADPVAWRQELEHARTDLLAVRPHAFGARDLVESELDRLRKAHPEAFVPDGVGPTAPESVEKP